MTMEYMTYNEEEFYSSKNYIKVIWEDTLDNHSKDREKAVQKYFERKYKTDKVKVVFTPILSKVNNISVDGSIDSSEIVTDENYQKQLIEQYIMNNNVNVQMPLLMKLDDSVNTELNSYKEYTSRHKTFRILEVEFSNFLSYGENNKVVFSDKSGVTSVISEPRNYGGKTTLTVDLLLFLFFGQTTKSDKNEDIFNRFTNEDYVNVRGKIEIDNNVYTIDRTITRKLQKDSYTYKSEVNFYQELPNGGVRQLNGEQRRYTDELIREYVGTYDDFLITILTTGDNLDDLIKTKPTERGRILTKFIGLEFFREKEKIVKEKYNDWKSKSKMHKNSSESLIQKIKQEKENIIQNQNLLIKKQKDLFSQEAQFEELNNKKEGLLLRRNNNINTELYKINESDILDGINKLNGLIETTNSRIDSLNTEVPRPSEEFDVDYYSVLSSDIKAVSEQELKLGVKRDDIKSKINNLKNSEICQSCKRPLEGIDFSAEINELEKSLVSCGLEIEEVLKMKNKLLENKSAMENLKNSWDLYNKNLLLLDKAKLELKNYEDSLNRGRDKLYEYNNIKVMIEENKTIDTEIQKLKFQIDSITQEKDMCKLSIRSVEKDIENSENKIKDYEVLMQDISKEEVYDKTFRVYLDMYGKNGISKMVLGTMIPLINSHLRILLSESADFYLELRMNDKNEVDFLMIDIESGVEKSVNSGSGYEKTVSSLALRCVLSKVCSLPKPNIIVFDEIAGKVANDNLDKIGLFFEKIKQFFEHIWIISHNPLIQDWADNVVRVKKINNISYVD